MSNSLHGIRYSIKMKSAYHDGSVMQALTLANINSAGVKNSAVMGELHWVEDPGILFMFDGTQNVPVAGRTNVTTVNAATYNLAPEDHILHVTYTGTGTVAIDLKTAQVKKGRVVVVKDAGGNAGANNITVTTEGAETIDGAATYVINANYGKVTLYCDGTNWFVI